MVGSRQPESGTSGLTSRLVGWTRVAGAVLALLLVAPPTGARSHEWYPPQCCTGRDCQPISDDRVQLTAAGFVVDGHWFVDYAEARQSLDGRYHLCVTPSGEFRCFYAPLGLT